MQNQGDNQQPACTFRQLELTTADLPLSCPPRTDAIWNAHPRVYLPLDQAGEVVCPYCGTKYILKDQVF